MEILIKNMVCRHCVEAVRKALSDAGFAVRDVALGRAEIEDADVSADGLRRIDGALAGEGFERIADADEALVESMKRAVISHVRDGNGCRFNLSACVEEHVGVDFARASRIFSRLEGRTVERFHILQKIEYVKELLGYGGANLAEIADMTGYSSAAHLSRQFKEVTGMTPTEYLRSGAAGRKSLPEV